MRAVAPVSTAPATAGVAPTRRRARHRRASTTRGVPKASAVDSEDVSTPTGPSRRGVLAAPLVAAAASAPTVGSLFAPPRARAEETRVLVVSSSGAADAGSAKTFPSVTAALAALGARGDASPASIRLSPGVYAERVVVPASLAGDLSIEPVAGAAPGSVTLEHRTGSPYEATVENQMPASRGAVTLRSVNVRHASPSVANNYAAFATPGSSLTLESCDVQSDTGSGIAAEGATLVVRDCRVHDCKSHGVAVYGDLLGEFGSGEVADCAVTRNGGDGVLLRQGAFGVVRGCVITDNGGFSVELVDCREGTTLRDNEWTGSKKRAAVRFGGYGEEDVVAENNVEV